MYVLANTMKRSDALASVSAFKDMLEDHLTKMAVYRDDLNCLDHWIREVSSILSKCGNYKTKSGKLSCDDYETNLFSYEEFDLNDAQHIAESFEQDNETYHEYPEFEVTSEVVERVYRMFSQVISFFPKYLADKKYVDRQTVQNKLREFVSNL